MTFVVVIVAVMMIAVVMIAVVLPFVHQDHLDHLVLLELLESLDKMVTLAQLAKDLLQLHAEEGLKDVRSALVVALDLMEHQVNLDVMGSQDPLDLLELEMAVVGDLDPREVEDQLDFLDKMENQDQQEFLAEMLKVEKVYQDQKDFLENLVPRGHQESLVIFHLVLPSPGFQDPLVFKGHPAPLVLMVTMVKLVALEMLARMLSIVPALGGADLSMSSKTRSREWKICWIEETS